MRTAASQFSVVQSRELEFEGSDSMHPGETNRDYSGDRSAKSILSWLIPTSALPRGTARIENESLMARRDLSSVHGEAPRSFMLDESKYNYKESSTGCDSLSW